MLRKSSKGRRKKTISKQSNPQGTVTSIEENRLQEAQRTPNKQRAWYMQDERWDIEPKTDYTYARSGSYSPRFFGRKYVNPNMSRYRIRSGRRSTTSVSNEDDDYIEISDVDEPDGHTSYHGDSDSDGSYETVYEEGMELRSGKSLHSLRQILHEHDSKLQLSESDSSSRKILLTTSLVESRSRSRRSLFDDNRNARSSKKVRHSDQRQISQSEKKQSYTSNIESYSQSQGLDYRNVRSRRGLDAQYASGSQQSNYYSNGNKTIEAYGKHGHNDMNSRQVGYTVKTVRTTVTEEFEDPENEVLEKDAVEMSEKESRLQQNHEVKEGYDFARRQRQSTSLSSLDSEGEFSDSNSYDGVDGSSTYRCRSQHSYYTNGSRYSDSNTSTTTTTVITTIAETISTIASPIVTPVWNAVGRPVWHYVGKPVSSASASLLYITLLVVTYPVVLFVKTVSSVTSWLWSSGANDVVDCIAFILMVLWRHATFISMQFVRWDTWFLKRRRRGCCFCLPLLLLIPLVLALYAGGAELWSGRSALFGFLRREVMHPCVPSGDSSQQLAYLNEEMQTLILQLQSSKQSQLTEADVTAIVQRLIAAERASLKADLDSSMNEDRLNLLQWKAGQEVGLEDMHKKQDALISEIQDLQTTIARHKTKTEADGSEMLSALEAKLKALQAELYALEQEHAALVLKMKDCCHNKTLLSALVKENVDAVLAQLMAGKESGNPAQDSFMAWLHSNSVSKEALDLRLKEVGSDVTASVMAMVKDMQESQQLVQEQPQNHVHVSAFGGTGVGEEHVKQMIEEALFRYSADKTGIPDFALESAGGNVVSTRCSETYYRKTALVSVFGLPLWYTSNSPRTVIQPEIYPGQCWPFRGTQGYIVIETSITITPTGFTLEHIPKALAPSGEIDSAPKEFTVLGLESEYDAEGTSLGNYTYNDNGKSMQFFPVQVAGSVKPFKLYELKISSNYGNMEYTCLYRFRIHGKPLKI